jgi:hypothetical protein
MPLQAIDGKEPDISQLCFHFWEPVWCLKGSAQIPAGRQWVRACYLGTAWNTGDTMCSHVQFDDIGENCNVVPRSLVIPCHSDESPPRSYFNINQIISFQPLSTRQYLLIKHKRLRGENVTMILTQITTQITTQMSKHLT